jgi:hypothetical protein
MASHLLRRCARSTTESRELVLSSLRINRANSRIPSRADISREAGQRLSPELLVVRKLNEIHRKTAQNSALS